VKRSARIDRRVTWHWLVALGVLYAGIAASGVWIAATAQSVRGSFVALERNQNEQDQLLDEYSRLLIERGTVSSYQNVDQVAERQLAMRFPETVQRVPSR
jgi:cell division protein FtsL